MKKNTQNDKRILGRRIAKPLDTAELKGIGGGRTTCSGGCADDCGQILAE
jgi:hypothetical protein